MTIRASIAFTALVLVTLMQGCASGYKEFYRPTDGVSPDIIALRRPSPPPATPAIERAASNNPQSVLDAYTKRGYQIIGDSMFNSGLQEPEEAAILQAKAVGADLVVILDPRYTGSVTSNVPVTTPTSSTSYSTATATVYGSRGPVTAYGSGTTTTYGTSTTYVPVTVHRSDFGAMYFVKQRFSIGIATRELNDSERLELQSNKGVATRLVVDGTPAFDADILVGDLIIGVNGQHISGEREFADAIRELRGKRITLSIVRKGQKIEKSVQLNP